MATVIELSAHRNTTNTMLSAEGLLDVTTPSNATSESEYWVKKMARLKQASDDLLRDAKNVANACEIDQTIPHLCNIFCKPDSILRTNDQSTIESLHKGMLADEVTKHSMLISDLMGDDLGVLIDNLQTAFQTDDVSIEFRGEYIAAILTQFASKAAIAVLATTVSKTRQLAKT